MQKQTGRYMWGIVLILAGVLFLLQQFDVIGSAFDLLWVIVLGAAGVVFLGVYISNPESWWAAIPGMTLIGLAAVVLDENLSLLSDVDWLGSLFLAFVGAGFGLVYIRKPVHWWAIIPGGVLVTLGLVSVLDLMRIPESGIFFLGLGATFALVGFLPRKAYSTRWAYIPAGVLAVIGLLQFVSPGSVLANYWPVILILVGGYILVMSLIKKESEEEKTDEETIISE